MIVLTSTTGRSRSANVIPIERTIAKTKQMQLKTIKTCIKIQTQ